MDEANSPAQKITNKIDRALWEESGEEFQLDMAAFHGHLDRTAAVSQLNNFGIWMLSIQEAAELIACDMWASGEVEVESLGDYTGSPLAPEVKASLTEVTSAFVPRLAKAIEIGRLKPERVMRDFDENIIPTETFIGFEQLAEWLSERGYDFGEVAGAWQDEELAIAERLADELILIRSAKGASKSPRLFVGFTGSPWLVDESSHSELLAAYKAAIIENQQLRERLTAAESRQQTNIEPPTSPKHRRTLLTLIAALLELLKAPVERARPQGMKQEAIKAAILEQYPWRGLSDRSLQTIFAAANKAKAGTE